MRILFYQSCYSYSKLFQNMAVCDNISSMRKPYKGQQDTFDDCDLVSKEPFGNFENWFNVACKTDSILEANAMSLATASKEGKPSVRMVLLKGFDKRGFEFFTNYRSQKARELDENPNAQLMFFWEPLNKSIRIGGTVEKLSDEESTKYFQSRPKSSQIGACVSTDQSSVIDSRKALEDRQKALEEKYKNEECVPKPDYWGGYRLKPDMFEFWQGQTNRIHDRLVFRQKSDAVDNTSEASWTLERLSP